MGIEYAKKYNAHLLLATAPDCDRVGVAVKDAVGEYVLLSGNEAGMLLDYICSQRIKHSKMPADPVMVKTVVTMDMGEQTALLEKQGREDAYIFGFEQSSGYLAGGYVRDKDGVDGAYMICEMFSYYAIQGISLMEKLNELYAKYGHCLNTLHSYEFEGSAGCAKMQQIMKQFREGVEAFGDKKLLKVQDYAQGQDGLPKSDVLKYLLEDNCSVVVRPSGTELKLKTYISVSAKNKDVAVEQEKKFAEELKRYFLG